MGGYDPYDALNSRLYQSLPILHSRLVRLVLTQGMKRCPLNLRPLLLVPRTQNPKGLALFMSALLKLSRIGLLEEQSLIKSLAESLQALRSPDSEYWCWGYSFPWQTRILLVPRGAPNLVCTTFVANALLDLYEVCHETRWLDMAVSAADYVLDELYWTEGDTVAGFKYPTPALKSQVHNANLLGAALLCRVALQSAKERFLEPALRWRVTRRAASGPTALGITARGLSIAGSTISTRGTICALCAASAPTQERASSRSESCVGLSITGSISLLKTPRRDTSTTGLYPLDIHTAAQSIITLLELKHLHRDNSLLARRVLHWALANLRAPSGCFFYQRNAWGTNKIPYMRWSQAWMLLALSVMLDEGHKPVAEDYGTNRE